MCSSNWDIRHDSVVCGQLGYKAAGTNRVSINVLQLTHSLYKYLVYPEVVQILA